MAIEKDILDQLLAGDPRALFEKDGLFDDLQKALAERVLNADLDGISTRRLARAGRTVATAPRS